MVEQILQSYNRAYGMNYIAFRYFNVCGADRKARHGQAPGATHIIARVLESIRDKKSFTLNGTNFDTPDGTCVRDYIHVEDVANAHILALNGLDNGIYNLGMNRGISNKEIIDTAERITGQKLDLSYGPSRPGDPACLEASADKIDRALPGWRKNNLDDVIRHAWAWYNK